MFLLQQYHMMYMYTVPDPPVITVDSTTATSITISGGVPSHSVADTYKVIRERDITVGCPDVDEGNATSFGEIVNLQEDSTYTITVTAFNSAGSSEVSNTVTAMTMEAGERDGHCYWSLCSVYVVCYSLQLLLVLPLLSQLVVHKTPSLSSGWRWPVLIIMET